MVGRRFATAYILATLRMILDYTRLLSTRVTKSLLCKPYFTYLVFEMYFYNLRFTRLESCATLQHSKQLINEDGINIHTQDEIQGIE